MNDAFPEIVDAKKVISLYDYDQFSGCHYCGETFPIKQVKLYWIHDTTLDDGREVVRMGIYCGDPCGNAMLSSYRMREG